jgi:hypothetical protein
LSGELLRIAYTYADSNSNRKCYCHGYSYSYSYSYSDSYSYSNIYSHSDTYRNGHRYTNCHSHYNSNAETYTYTALGAVTQASTDASASPVVGNVNEKTTQRIDYATLIRNTLCLLLLAIGFFPPKTQVGRGDRP